MVKWKDNKVVTVISNDRGIGPKSTVSRFSKEIKRREEVECPDMVKHYNAHMGRIDKSDMLTHLYKTPAKSVRWYLRLFAHALDLSIANCWLLYKRDCFSLKISPMPLKKFRLEIYKFATAENPIIDRQTSASLTSDDFKILPVIKGQHVQHPPNSLRYMSKFHCPMPVERQNMQIL